MRVKIERNDHLNMQLRHAARLHAGAPTDEDTTEFRLTPSQAVLVWWAMHQLERALRGSAGFLPTTTGDLYADDLRCHADAVEWSFQFRQRLAAHANAHKVEISVCD